MAETGALSQFGSISTTLDSEWDAVIDNAGSDSEETTVGGGRFQELITDIGGFVNAYNLNNDLSEGGLGDRVEVQYDAESNTFSLSIDGVVPEEYEGLSKTEITNLTAGILAKQENATLINDELALHGIDASVEYDPATDSYALTYAGEELGNYNSLGDALQDVAGLQATSQLNDKLAENGLDNYAVEFNLESNTYSLLQDGQVIGEFDSFRSTLEEVNALAQEANPDPGSSATDEETLFP